LLRSESVQFILLYKCPAGRAKISSRRKRERERLAKLLIGMIDRHGKDRQRNKERKSDRKKERKKELTTKIPSKLPGRDQLVTNNEVVRSEI
jgi:hypothetical protein